MLKVISPATSFLEWGVAFPAGSVGPLGTAGLGAPACTCPQQGGPPAGRWGQETWLTVRAGPGGCFGSGVQGDLEPNLVSDLRALTANPKICFSEPLSPQATLGRQGTGLPGPGQGFQDGGHSSRPRGAGGAEVAPTKETPGQEGVPGLQGAVWTGLGAGGS